MFEACPYKINSNAITAGCMKTEDSFYVKKKRPMQRLKKSFVSYINKTTKISYSHF